VSTIEKIELPESGGLYTFMKGKDYPFQGFPYWEFVDAIDKVKKLAKAQASGIYHNVIKGNKLKLLTLIPALWAIKRIFPIEIYTFYRWVERFKLKPLRYCIAVRELYWIFTMDRENEPLEEKNLRLMIRDVICMIMEFDNAYRFRMQDLLAEMDIEAFKKKPTKELKRIIKIAQSRELRQEGKDMWTLMDTIVVTYLLIDRKFKKMLVDIFSNLNKEKISLNESDKFYAKGRKDYKFGFM
jgi:hypothetical protein